MLKLILIQSSVEFLGELKIDVAAFGDLLGLRDGQSGSCQLREVLVDSCVCSLGGFHRRHHHHGRCCYMQYLLFEESKRYLEMDFGEDRIIWMAEE